MLLDLLDALAGVRSIDATPYLEILEKCKEADTPKPAHEVLLEAAATVSKIDLRTPHHAAEDARKHLRWQVFYRFDDVLPSDAMAEIMRTLLVGEMNAARWCDDMVLAYIVRHIGFVEAAVLARSLGHRPIWVRRQFWEEGQERFQIVTDEVVLSFEQDDPDQDPDKKITYRDAE